MLRGEWKISATELPMRFWPVLLVLTACRNPEPAITLRTWRVVALGDRIAPVGAGGNYLTMYFGPGTGRVSGFAGCNQYNPPYTLVGDSFTIGSPGATRV